MKNSLRRKGESLILNLFVVILIIKLGTSFSIIENPDEVAPEKTNLGLSNIYYFCDYLIILLSGFAIMLNGIKNVISRKIFITLFILFVLHCITNIIHQNTIFNVLGSYFKIASPIFPFLCITEFNTITERQIYRVARSLIGAVVLFSAYAYLTFPVSVNRGEIFWPIYFTGLHSHAYVILATYFLSVLILKKGNWQFIFLSVLVFYALFFGYNVRTTVLALVGGYYAYFLYNSRNISTRIIFTKLIPIFFIISLCVYLIFFFDIESLTGFSSGRILMYAQKIHILTSRSLVDTLFGEGVGSDFIETDIWWWEAKGSHNDYLTIFTENGILFLFVFIYLIYNLFKYKEGGLIQKSILVSYIIASMVSNGFFFRPMPSYILFIALSLNILHSRRIESDFISKFLQKMNFKIA